MHSAIAVGRKNDQKMICLANSKKFSERCVAGIEKPCKLKRMKPKKHLKKIGKGICLDQRYPTSLIQAMD